MSRGLMSGSEGWIIPSQSSADEIWSSIKGGASSGWDNTGGRILGGEGEASGEAMDHFDFSNRNARIENIGNLLSFAEDVDYAKGLGRPRGMGVETLTEWVSDTSDSMNFTTWSPILYNLADCVIPLNGSVTEGVYIMFAAALNFGDKETIRDCVEEWFMLPEVRGVMAITPGINWGGDFGDVPEEIEEGADATGGLGDTSLTRWATPILPGDSN